MTTLKRDEKTPARQALQTFLAFVLLFLLYAIAVQVTEIDLEKMRSENRQTQLVGVLRFLADPDITNPDIIDPLFVPESESFSLTETTVNTLNLIMETIFMALLATTIGTILAVPVSFLAARNLMLEVTSPLASFMLALALLPVGGGLAWLGAREMVALAATFSAQPALTLGIFVATLALGWAVVRFGPPLVTTTRRDSRGTAVAIAELVFLVLLALFALAQLAALSQVSGLWLADQLDAAAFNVGLFSINFSFVGNFFKVMGDLISLALPAVTALLGAMIAMLLGSRYGQEAILRLTGTPARLVTAVFTFLGTAVFIFGSGTILNWLYQFDSPANWTTIPALAGGGILAVGSLLLAPKRPFRIGFGLYTIARAIFNTLRSIEPLIMAIIFVVWVGLGPFAGVMALTLHTIAALGKLFSEQIEGIDDGPIEAINATGASRLQMIVFAVIPQIIPPYIAYTLYRWDINVRMSTIIGFVGGGGIGFLLSQSVRLLRYREASVMMLAIAIVVSLLDYLSANVRRRVI
ncbi:MAG: phosphonate ABC transporter, permease protein PhnE [Anaerolineales bacterium]|nr:phosphonate ABC transporter, permease protein PhnE [Anaerolineales bacterium]